MDFECRGRGPEVLRAEKSTKIQADYKSGLYPYVVLLQQHSRASPEYLDTLFLNLQGRVPLSATLLDKSRSADDPQSCTVCQMHKHIPLHICSFPFWKWPAATNKTVCR